MGNGLINDCRYKFSLDFFNSFFNFALLQLWNMCTNLRKAAHNCYWITGILVGNGLIIDCMYGFLLNYYFLFFNFVLLQLQSRCTKFWKAACSRSWVTGVWWEMSWLMTAGTNSERLHPSVLELREFLVEMGWLWGLHKIKVSFIIQVTFIAHKGNTRWEWSTEPCFNCFIIPTI